MDVTQVCKITRQPFELHKREADAYRHFNLPLPSISPHERFRRQLAFKGRQQFYWRKCDITGKRIYSIYPKKAPFPVISSELWYSDEWDPLQYGRKFKPKKSFLEQLFALWQVVPRPAQAAKGVAHSYAIYDARHIADSFLVSEAEHVERSCYSVGLRSCVDCCDCLNVSHCSDCYECIDCHECSLLRWAEHCWGCRDSWFLSNCQNCKHCLFCANLQDKEYYIFNEKVTPEDYEKTLAELKLNNRTMLETARKKFFGFLKTREVSKRYVDDWDSTTGNYLYQTTNAYESYNCSDCRDIVRCCSLTKAKHCLDGHSFGDDISESAQFVSCGMKATHLLNCVDCFDHVSHLAYCFNCEKSSHLLGCVGLREKEYCILNKQYTKAEYQETRFFIEAQMREKHQWAAYLQIAFSPFAYNQSAAQEYIPLNEIQAALMSYLWETDEDELVKPSQLLGGDDEPSERYSEIPAEISEIDRDARRTTVYLCEMSGKPFQFSEMELLLYDRMGVPPPGRVFEQRHKERIARLGLWR